MELCLSNFRCKNHPLWKVCKGLQFIVYQKALEIIRQSDDKNSSGDYLNANDSITHRPKLPMAEKIESTGCRDKRYSTASDELIDDYGTTPRPESSSCNQSDNTQTEHQNSTSEEIKDSQSNLDNVDAALPGKSETASSAVLRQKYSTGRVESFEKIYEDLEDAIFSSDSDGSDADDDAGDSKDGTLKNEDTDEGTLKKAYGDDSTTTTTTTTTVTEVDDVGRTIKRESNDDDVYINYSQAPTNGEVKSKQNKIEHSENATYFAINNLAEKIDLTKEIATVNDDESNPTDPVYVNPYDSLKQDETSTPLYETAWNGTNTEGGGDSGYELPWDLNSKLKRISEQRMEQEKTTEVEEVEEEDEYDSPYDKKENITPPPGGEDGDYDAPWDKRNPESPKKPLVAIQIHSPNTPRGDCSGPEPPLPDRYSSEGEVEGESEYSDIGEEFQEDNLYEGLQQPPNYEDNDDDNIYEDLDSLDGKNASVTTKDISSDLTTSDDSYRLDSEKNDTKTFTIDSFYLKKLDSIIQEIRFGIGKNMLFFVFHSVFNPKFPLRKCSVYLSRFSI